MIRYIQLIFASVLSVLAFSQRLMRPKSIMHPNFRTTGSGGLGGLKGPIGVIEWDIILGKSGATRFAQR